MAVESNLTPEPAPGTPTAKVTRENHYLFGRIVHVLQEGEHEVVVAFEEAGKWIKDKIEPSAVTKTSTSAPATGTGTSEADKVSDKSAEDIADLKAGQLTGTVIASQQTTPMPISNPSVPTTPNVPSA